MAIATLWLGALGLFTSTGALLDIFTRRLPNILCGVMLLAGFGLAFASGGWTALGLHAAHSVLALVVGYLLFLAGVFGGGDGKFYAAAASFFPLSGMLMLFVAITAAGLLLYIFWSLLTRIMPSRIGKGGDFGKLPYGVAIGGGALAYAGFLFL
ncbi:prepilin peptidase [Qipengyuania sp. 1NDH17]|uniref:Prepilin peptidase n=1 Tax=Qipengyuania polymorpha TaxID=2867234 RepID=A0ABS7J6B4_9SPHN|nr:prepilin peptidase [Qipengyuania polymorpha]MBX7458993.1 prepilin peptidase [Qipengyuania polymorpha]